MGFKVFDSQVAKENRRKCYCSGVKEGGGDWKGVSENIPYLLEFNFLTITVGTYWRLVAYILNFHGKSIFLLTQKEEKSLP